MKKEHYESQITCKAEHPPSDNREFTVFVNGVISLSSFFIIQLVQESNSILLFKCEFATLYIVLPKQSKYVGINKCIDSNSFFLRYCDISRPSSII